MTTKGTDLEDQHFFREEQEKISKIRAAEEAKKVAEEKAALKALHHLHCGKCGSKMDTQLFKGVEIEVCPACGAVLLDAGELEKIAGPDQSGFVATLGELFSFSKRK